MMATKLRDLLEQRFAKKESDKTAGGKMGALAERASQGSLTSFSGIFGHVTLNASERTKLAELLQRYSEGSQNSDRALEQLAEITAEVRAINNQAAMLHGERIKRAQEILRSYREGAFTAWLLATYGNRQTPYNFLQYYEFHTQMPAALHAQIELMPRQAIYTLASREGALEEKVAVIQNYKGETKEELLSKIRSLFPLSHLDKRREDPFHMALTALQKLYNNLAARELHLSASQRKKMIELLKQIQGLIE